MVLIQTYFTNTSLYKETWDKDSEVIYTFLVSVSVKIKKKF